MPESHALAIQSQAALTGYGVIRKCRNGYKIGPLFADSSHAAETLFLALIDRVEAGAPVFLDVPEVNPQAVRLAESHGMTPVFSTARMYNRGQPDVRLDRIYGVTTFELG
jgi:Acetyltransferase (GNAT) domain